MIKVSVFVATSVDGYLARPDGSLDWLPPGEPGGEDYGYQEFYATVDAVVMGRKTYEVCESFEQWPYSGKRVVVWSRRLSTRSPAFDGQLEFSARPPRDLLGSLEEAGVRHVYADGGATIQAFLAEGLVNEITVTCVPILLGQGVALFGRLERDIRLHLLRTRAFPDGLVQSTYAVESQ